MKPKRIRACTRIQQRARELRQTMTPAERNLWEHLRNRQLSGLKFRRQHPIGTCIADFYCAEAHLVIEIDGAIHHAQVEADAGRSQELEAQDYQVIRFTNEQVEVDLDRVLSTILAACQPKAPLPHAGG